MRTPIDSAQVTDTAERIELLRTVATDVAEAGKVADLQLVDGDALWVDTTLAPADA
jgi:hypothetical protein